MEPTEITETTVDNVVNRLRRTKLKSKENIGLIQVTMDQKYPVYIGESSIRSGKDLKKDSVILSFNGLAEKMLKAVQEDLSTEKEPGASRIQEAFEVFRSFKEKIKEILDKTELFLFTNVFLASHSLSFIQKCINGQFETDEAFLEELQPVIRSYAIENQDQMLQESLEILKEGVVASAKTFTDSMRKQIGNIQENIQKMTTVQTPENGMSNAASVASLKGASDSRKSIGLKESPSKNTVEDKKLQGQSIGGRGDSNQSLRSGKQEGNGLMETPKKEEAKSNSSSKKGALSNQKAEEKPNAKEPVKSLKAIESSKSLQIEEEKQSVASYRSQRETKMNEASSRDKLKKSESIKQEDKGKVESVKQEEPLKNESLNSNRTNDKTEANPFKNIKSEGWPGSSLHFSGGNQANQHFLTNSYFDPDFRPWATGFRPETSPARFRPELREVSLMTDKMEIPSSLVNKEDAYDFFSPRIKKSMNGDPVYSLLFKASRDGFGFSDFHSICDDKGATLTIVKTTRARIFGGFASISWGKGGTFHEDEEAFLFSWDLREIYEQKQNKGSAIFWGFDKNCPTFGLGSDLAIMADANKNANSYLKMNGTFSSGETQRDAISGGEYFEVADYEVFLVRTLEETL